jgi:AraC-like DNA-binding protein
MMEGVDAGWIDADTRRVTYSKLDKGTYRFVLAASNSDGVWSEKKAVLDIKVHPIWYRSLLAEVFFMILTLLILVYLAYRLKAYMEIRNAEKIGQLKRRYEEDVRRVRVASYVTDPYLLKASDVEFIDRVINHIDENIVNPQFSVEALSSMMNMTRANLHLKVKNMTGISPVELIRKIRIEAACRMIRAGRYTLTEIAEKSGFNSTSYFTVTFKKVAGCTPSEYSSKSASKGDI